MNATEVKHRIETMNRQHSGPQITIEVPEELARNVLREFQERKDVSQRDVEYCSKIIDDILSKLDRASVNSFP